MCCSFGTETDTIVGLGPHFVSFSRDWNGVFGNEQELQCRKMWRMSTFLKHVNNSINHPPLTSQIRKTASLGLRMNICSRLSPFFTSLHLIHWIRPCFHHLLLWANWQFTKCDVKVQKKWHYIEQILHDVLNDLVTGKSFLKLNKFISRFTHSFHWPQNNNEEFSRKCRNTRNTGEERG